MNISTLKSLGGTPGRNVLDKRPQSKSAVQTNKESLANTHKQKAQGRVGVLVPVATQGKFEGSQFNCVSLLTFHRILTQE
jgi:hypothetical protein